MIIKCPVRIVTQPKLRNNHRYFPGRHPLKRIDDEISMFPAGMLLTNGWLSHIFVDSQASHVCIIRRNDPITNFVIDMEDEWHWQQKWNSDSKAVSKTRYFATDTTFRFCVRFSSADCDEENETSVVPVSFESKWSKSLSASVTSMSSSLTLLSLVSIRLHWIPISFVSVILVCIPKRSAWNYPIAVILHTFWSSFVISLNFNMLMWDFYLSACILRWILHA